MFCRGPSEPLFRFEQCVTNLNGAPSHGHSDIGGVVVSVICVESSSFAFRVLPSALYPLSSAV